MSSTVLEQIRAEQEDIEFCERKIVSILREKPRNHRSRVLHGHKVNNLLNQVVQRSNHVSDLYLDKDRTFQNELESVRGRATFTSFYEQLKSIRSFHQKYPNTPVLHEPNLEDALNPQVTFSGEERFGKYVDLNEFYTRFLNISAFQWEMSSNRLEKSIKIRSGKKSSLNSSHAPRNNFEKVNYITYLAIYSKFDGIPQHEKHNDQYQMYLNDLKEYLLNFYRRTQPLVDLDDVMDETRQKFEKDWVLKQVTGWEIDREVHQNSSSENPPDETYCQACKRQYSSVGVYKGHLNGKKHKKAVAVMPKNDDAEKKNETELKEIAFNEVLIRRLDELLTEVIHATISYLELKQTRTHAELQAEIAEEEEGQFSDVDIDNVNGGDGDDDEEPFYNPLNLPLGWDGKPIPYWLYKLHGLGVEYKCEICGNHSYWGRRAFDRHFQEWRHAFGMRCLKIPNTKHFHDITLMSDAIHLYEKLKGQIDEECWNPENEEEFEDSEGNVFNRKTYEDLARQGLL